MNFENIDEYRDAMVKAYAKDEYYKGYEAGKKDAVKHGRWVQIGPPNENSETLYRCSICDYLEVVPLYDTNNYCANCGARMDGDKK